MVWHRLTRSRFFYFIIFLILSGYSCTCTQITITRTNGSFDVFTTTQTNCNAFCSAKNSKLLVLRNTSSSCACRCDFNASTFVFKRDLTSSACMDNVKIQSTLGHCHLLLDKNTITSPLPVLDLSIPGTRVLTGPVNGSSTCSVFQEEFLVNGTWFAVAGGNLTTFATDRNILKWSSVSSGSLYTGRIVRVQFHCDAKTLCLVIKIKGQIIYDVSIPVIPTSVILHPSPSTSYIHIPCCASSTDDVSIPVIPTSVILHPSPSTSFIKSVYTTSSTNHDTSGLQFTSSKTENLISLQPATISPTLATVVMVTSSAVVIGGTKAVQDGCERGTWVFCQRFYLGIAAVGTVVLLILVITLISCACIRRRRRSLRHQKPAGLTNLEETDSSTELALIEDFKPKNEDHKGQNTEEAFYQNVPRREKPDKIQLYRPLRSSDGRDSPTTPTSPGRISYASSTNEVTMYDDNTDSNQLIKSNPGSQSSTPASKRLKTFCPSPVVHSKKEFRSNQAVLDSEEEATYEIMEDKTLPQSRKINRANNESITGFENRVFEEDDHRQSHYDVVSDEQPNYENLEGAYQEEQPNYETMQEHRNGVVMNNTQEEGKSYPGVDEEQENYETMDTFSGEEQLDYETMNQDKKPGAQESYLLYEKMGSHKNWDPDNEIENDETEDEREYDIPVITEDEHDSHYDIPELDLELQQEQDDPGYHYAVNTSGNNKSPGLRVLMDLKHDHGDDNDYVYANVPEIQANNLREKLRNTWHSGEQQGGEEASRESKIVDEKPGTDKRPSSWNTNLAGKNNKKTVHEDDKEELYSLPDDFPKPLPSCLLKSSSSPQLKRTQANNQASPKQKQRSEKTKPKDSAGVSSRAPLGNPKTSKPDVKDNIPLSNMMKKGKASLEKPENSKVEKPSITGRDMKKDRLELSNREGKTTAMKNNQSSTNKPNKSTGSTSSPNQQPLYTNLVEMENETRQTLAKENTDAQTDQDLIDQQPLYENIGTMVSHVE